MVFYPNVPDGCTGFILGREADRLKHLMHASGTYIEKTSVGSLPKFSIIGLPEDVEKAKKLFELVIDGRVEPESSFFFFSFPSQRLFY